LVLVGSQQNSVSQYRRCPDPESFSPLSVSIIGVAADSPWSRSWTRFSAPTRLSLPRRRMAATARTAVATTRPARCAPARLELGEVVRLCPVSQGVHPRGAPPVLGESGRHVIVDRMRRAGWTHFQRYCSGIPILLRVKILMRTSIPHVTLSTYQLRPHLDGVQQRQCLPQLKVMTVVAVVTSPLVLLY
jgi:hypothetical protein